MKYYNYKTKEKQRKPMPNYQNGKIYSIRSRSREDLIYIGSTTQNLSVRLGEHKYRKNKGLKYSSKQIIELGDAYIELIENYPCNSKEELTRREGQIIRITNCINKQIAGRTNKQYREDNKESLKEKAKQYYEANKETVTRRVKEYREANKEKIAQRTKKYREANKEKIRERHKQYHQENKEKICQRVKNWVENNKERVIENRKKRYEKNKELSKEYSKKYYEANKEKLREKYQCECGSVLTRGNKTRHFKSKKHQDHINSL